MSASATIVVYWSDRSYGYVAGFIQAEPSEMAHSTTSTRMPNTVEEGIRLTSRSPKPTNQPSETVPDIRLQTRPFNLSTLRKATISMLQPEAPIHPPPNTWRSIRAIVFASCELQFCAIHGLHWFRPRVECLIGLYPNICIFLSFFTRIIWVLWQWAVNFALPNQHTLIFICKLTNRLSFRMTSHLPSVTFLAIIPLAKVTRFRMFSQLPTFNVPAASCLCHWWAFTTSRSNSCWSPQCHIS